MVLCEALADVEINGELLNIFLVEEIIIIYF